DVLMQIEEEFRRANAGKAVEFLGVDVPQAGTKERNSYFLEYKVGDKYYRRFVIEKSFETRLELDKSAVPGAKNADKFTLRAPEEIVGKPQLLPKETLSKELRSKTSGELKQFFKAFRDNFLR